MPSTQPEQLQPVTIGPFRIVRLLGAGGMGSVYLGERIEQFSQQVAIKVLHPSLFPREAEASIVHEGQILSTLDHPGIVRILGRSASDGFTYIVMEFVDGLSIDTFCDLHRLSLRRRCEIFAEVLEAVAYAHRHLVVHADLKPGNILVKTDGTPRLLDFGVSSIVTAHPAQSAAFTTLYASPEQLAGERLTLASDVYALGLIAQQLLAGLPPYPATPQHTPPSALQRLKRLSNLDQPTLEAIAAARSTTPAKLESALRGDLEALLTKALQPAVADRFQSAQELCDEFRNYLRGFPIRTRRIPWPARLHKWILRNRLVAAVAAALLAAILLSTVGVVVRYRAATRNRQLANARLLELVRLTDDLAGELYDSVHGLPGAEAPQKSLLATAHQTIYKLETEHDNERALQLVLAQEYDKLARLELSVSPATAETAALAQDDRSRELRILKRLPATDPAVQALLRNIPPSVRSREP